MIDLSFNVISKCKYGQMIYNKHDIYIGKSLAYYGEYSDGEVDVFRQILQEGHVVVEAGANIGAHTVPLAQLVGDAGQVYAFEPQRRVFQVLNGNIAINSLRNVFCLQKALSDKSGNLLVPILSTEVSNNFGALELGEWTYGEEVDVTTIDSMKLSSCRLIKIDVEGMELNVLRGARETIKKLKPVLYVEIDRAEKTKEIISYVDKLGYDMYMNEVPLYNKNNFNGKEDDIFLGEKGAICVSKNMLCIPKNGKFNITGFQKISI